MINNEKNKIEKANIEAERWKEYFDSYKGVMIKNTSNDQKAIKENCSYHGNTIEKREYLLKTAIRKISGLNNIDNLNSFEKIRLGVPMRLKNWIKGMYIIYFDKQLFLINDNNNSIMEIDSVLILLEHDNTEWEEYDIPKKYYSNITKEIYNYFIENIYNKFVTNDIISYKQQNSLIDVKLFLEELM